MRTALSADAGAGLDLVLPIAPGPSEACRHFSMAELDAATDGFSSQRVLGEGGFGKVRVWRCLVDCSFAPLIEGLLQARINTSVEHGSWLLIPCAFFRRLPPRKSSHLRSLPAFANSEASAPVPISQPGVRCTGRIDGSGELTMAWPVLQVYKGTLRDGRAVAVKRLDRSGLAGDRQFDVEVTTLNLMQHPNIVGLLGVCTEGDERMAVLELASQVSHTPAPEDLALEPQIPDPDFPEEIVECELPHTGRGILPLVVDKSTFDLPTCAELA